MYEDAYLAEIKSGATQELLAEYADSLPDYHWWLGGTDYFEVGSTIHIFFNYVFELYITIDNVLGWCMEMGKK